MLKLSPSEILTRMISNKNLKTSTQLFGRNKKKYIDIYRITNETVCGKEMMRYRTSLYEHQTD